METHVHLGSQFTSKRGGEGKAVKTASYVPFLFESASTKTV